MDDNIPSRIMPYSYEAEQSVLGAIFLNTECIPDVVELIKPDDFYMPRNRELYQAMIDLYNTGVPVDLVTLVDSLKSRGTFESVGGINYIIEISNFVPTSANVRHYAKIVEEKSILRKLIAAAGEINDLSYEGAEDAETILAKAEQSIFNIAGDRVSKGFLHIKTVLLQNWDNLALLAEKKEETIGVPTGFLDLDKMTAGLHPSDFILIAARPAMGKTAFALNIAQFAAVRHHKTVALFNLEMSAEQLASRMLASEAMVSASRLKTADLRDEDWIKLGEAMEPLSKSPIYINDTSNISVTEIGAKCRRLKLEKGLDLIVIDYLQLMQGSRRNENRQQEISDISRSLKILAKELEVPIIALSQLSRAPEARSDHRPMLSDLRESGAIEQDADLVMFIYRDDYYDEDSEERNVAECIIAKHRNGETGTVKLTWLGEYTKFSNMSTSRGEG